MISGKLVFLKDRKGSKDPLSSILPQGFGLGSVFVVVIHIEFHFRRAIHPDIFHPQDHITTIPLPRPLNKIFHPFPLLFPQHQYHYFTLCEHGQNCETTDSGLFSSCLRNTFGGVFDPDLFILMSDPERRVAWQQIGADRFSARVWREHSCLQAGAEIY